MSSTSAFFSTVSGLSSEHPFPGLRPFEEPDSEWFFGRSSEINELLKRLRRVRFVAIVGPSGCGKSSLIKAGVLPSVRDGYLDSSWSIAVFRPGEQPLDNLARAVSSAISADTQEIRKLLDNGSIGLVKAIQSRRLPSQSRLLVLVDQFEELFQFAQRHGDQSQEEVKAFLKLLLAAAASDDVPVYLVITMRMEWLSESATYVGLAEVINHGIYLVPQMSRRQFQQVILNPIDAAGGMITTTMLDRMLNDLGGRSDQLPVLQHALMRLWEHRRPGEPLDIANYKSVGTFSNCLSNHAEEVFGELSDDQQKTAELLFRSITEVYKNRKVRRPRPFGELASMPGMKETDLKVAIEAFSRRGRSFLFTSDGVLEASSIIDISHEALMRQWDRLREWVENEADVQSRLARLQEDATEWDRGERKDRSVLYSGYKLQRAEELRPRVEASTAVLEFLQVSRRAERQARVLKRGALVALFLFLVVSVGILWREYRSARLAEARARESAVRASVSAERARESAAQADKLQVLLTESAQAVLAARNSADSKQALASLENTVKAVEASKSANNAGQEKTTTEKAAEEKATADRAAADKAAADKAVADKAAAEKAAAYRAASDKAAAERVLPQGLVLKGCSGEVNSVAWSPDGKRLAAGDGAGTAVIWDAPSGEEVLTLKGHTDQVYSVAWSPDGKRLATGSRDSTTKVWDAATGQMLLTLNGHFSNDSVISVAWSPDGKRLATAGVTDARVVVFDVATAHEVLTLDLKSYLNSVAWSPDGKRLATGSWDRTAQVWDAASGTELLTLKGHTGYVKSVAWSPDGRRLATASDDDTAKVWDSASGQELLTLKGHTSEVFSVAWSPDGKRLATTGYSDQTTKVWDAASGRELLTLKGPSSYVYSVTWSPDGKSLAAAGGFKPAVTVWDIPSGRE